MKNFLLMKVKTIYKDKREDIISNKNLPHIFELQINLASNFINSYTNTVSNLDLKYESKLIYIQYEIFRIELEKMKLIYETVVLGKFTKILLEKIIYIDNIDLENYSPEIHNLNSYLIYLNKYYIPNKDKTENIEKDITNLIKIAHENEKNKKVIKTNPKIYL